MTTSTPVEDKKINVVLSKKEEGKRRLEKLKQEEMRMVRGTFRCYDAPGAPVRLCVKKYKDTPVFDKTLVDGQEYEIPLYVARHLNGIDKTAAEIPNGKINSCAYPIHAYAINQAGVPLINVGQYRSRFGFMSADFN